MTKLLEFKEVLNHFYARNGRYLQPVFKFIIALVVFTLINRSIGYDQRFNNMLVVLGLSVPCAFLPAAILVIVAAMFTALHVYYVSPMLSIIVVIIFLILYLLFIRFMPKSGYAVLAVPVLYTLNIPFTVPVLLGIVSGPIAIIPVSCGVIIFYLFKAIKEAILVGNGSSVEDILGVYKYVIDHLMNNKEMILAIIVFGIVLLLTYFIRNLSIDYAFYIAILAGVVVNVLAFLIGGLILNITMKLAFVIIGSILSGILVVVIQFFRLNLDYSTVEFTQFEDDDYYYYVKAVPKVKITAPKKDVKRINGENKKENTESELEWNEDMQH